MIFPQFHVPGRFQNMPTFIPVGSVIGFAGQVSDPLQEGSKQPDNSTIVESQGWMVCDGRPLNIADYNVLYAAIGELYNTGRQGSGQFCIPDYRGYFLRMVDLGTGNDPDASGRTPVGSGLVGDPGSIQYDALQDHVHQVNNAKVPQIPMGGEGSEINSLPGDTEGPSTPPNATTVNVSQNETRPKNIYIYYLIKFIF